MRFHMIEKYFKFLTNPQQALSGGGERKPQLFFKVLEITLTTCAKVRLTNRSRWKVLEGGGGGIYESLGMSNVVV